jgi:hypothetical protein
MFAVVVIANVFTYWFLCRPEFEMREKDPEGYAYLESVLGHAGGILALSTAQRCAVHCLFTTVLILTVFAVSWGLSRYRRSRHLRKPTEKESGP